MLWKSRGLFIVLYKNNNNDIIIINLGYFSKNFILIKILNTSLRYVLA